MGIPLRAGRDFTAGDTADAPKVANVSERIVREYFPGGPTEALGRRVRLDPTMASTFEHVRGKP